jgi:hypothetical protein
MSEGFERAEKGSNGSTKQPGMGRGMKRQPAPIPEGEKKACYPKV